MFLSNIVKCLASQITEIPLDVGSVLCQSCKNDVFKGMEGSVKYVKFTAGEHPVVILTQMPHDVKDYPAKLAEALKAAYKETCKREIKIDGLTSGDLTDDIINSLANMRLIWIELVTSNHEQLMAIVIPYKLAEDVLSSVVKSPTQDLSSAFADSAFEAGDDTGRKSILIIEDVAKIRTIQKQFLESASYRVVEAEDVRTARQKLINGSFDLIILDVGLPDVDGFTFCDELKADDRTKSIPVLVCTASATKESVMRSKKSKADAYLVKPFTKTQLLERVSQLLSTPGSQA